MKKSYGIPSIEREQLQSGHQPEKSCEKER
jgi:hypothetical protein